MYRQPRVKFTPRARCFIAAGLIVAVAVIVLLLAACTAATPTPSLPFPDARPGPDWTRVVAPGWSSQRGFSLMLPPGWELNELQGIDSYIGEVTGDDIRLRFDYGGYSWGLNPEDEPEFDYEYLESYEDIGGLPAKLLVSMDPYGGHTGVYFENLGGPSLNLIGWGLTPEQQRVALAIFRSIRVAE